MVHKMVTRPTALCIGTAKTRCPLVRKKGRDKQTEMNLSFSRLSIRQVSQSQVWNYGRLEGADNVNTFLRKEYIRSLVQVSKVFISIWCNELVYKSHKTLGTAQTRCPIVRKKGRYKQK